MQMPRGLHHCFSPDGTRIAYTSKGFLRVEGLDGADVASFAIESVSGVKWCGGFSLILHTDNRDRNRSELAVIDIRSGVKSLIGATSSHGSLASYGGDCTVTYLGYLDEVYGIHQLSAESRSSRTVSVLDKFLEGHEISAFSGHAWSPCRDCLALIARKVCGSGAGRIAETGFSESEIALVDQHGNRWSNDAWQKHNEERGPFRLYLIDRDSAAREIADSDQCSSPTWSPSGRSIVLIRRRGIKRTVWLYNMAEDRLREFDRRYVPFGYAVSQSGELHYRCVSDEHFPDFRKARWCEELVP